MPTANPKPPSYLPELKTFVENHRATPYGELLGAAASAGWETLVTELEATGQPDGTTLVRFAVAVGRDGKFEHFDNVTVRTGVGPGPVSIAARLALPQSLIYLFFGRLPEPLRQAEQVVNVEQQPEGDIHLPGENPLPPDNEQELVADSAPITRRAKAEAERMPPLVDHFEPDGVPIFIDLDTVPERFGTGEIIDALLADMNTAAVKFTGKEQLLALYAKNEPAVGFLKELGSTEDKAALAKMLSEHQARIEAASVVREVRIPGGKGSGAEAGPRRRRAA